MAARVSAKMSARAAVGPGALDLGASHSDRVAERPGVGPRWGTGGVGFTVADVYALPRKPFAVTNPKTGLRGTVDGCFIVESAFVGRCPTKCKAGQPHVQDIW